MREQEAARAEAARQAQAREQAQQREAERTRQQWQREQAAWDAQRQAEAQRQQRQQRQAWAAEKQRADQEPSCRARMASYRSDEQQLQAAKQFAPQVRSVQEAFDGRGDVRRAQSELRIAKYRGEAASNALRGMQGEEGRFRAEHPIRAALGQSPKTSQRNWHGVIQQRRSNMAEAAAQEAAAQKKLDALARDPQVAAACQRDVADE